jgi:hypothetical protein
MRSARGPVPSLVLLAVAAAGSARAQPEQAPLDDDTRACVLAFGEAQRLRREGSLRAAREQLLFCAQPSCPAVIVGKCVPWLAEVELGIPTVIVSARGPDGRDSVEVRVLSDGEPIVDRLDGLPISLDPGPRRLRFERAGVDPIELDVLLTQGEKDRRIEVRFPASGAVPAAGVATAPVVASAPRMARPTSPARERAAGSFSPLVWIGAGVGGSGLLLGAITGAVAVAEARRIEDACGGTLCGEEHRAEYDRGQTVAHVSTAGFALAGVGAAVSAVGLLLGRGAAASRTVRATLRPDGFAVQGRF